jgi:hypothetical protein
MKVIDVSAPPTKEPTVFLTLYGRASKRLHGFDL